ncbi:MAG: hypothetical protein A3B81_02630 [Candidatus Muproteobacteria bacterium RIFCSPHIGHO2_02_FULL_65_16]|uniref:Polymerase nucleotidyl transferase domain-containing protein n=1 Tax=Candidatus Muproteobacteria bacterium RIFCSPHIGHO2_02_FULL_65_16 TaxID=1817766 RepID=A0A1F6TTE6_9PROT|nr:MAG: hypothetical protein A3B81_02630 [Candidatus Muproteobacteria bacterium RIFCSPHIGHO2_02_FULL_65_16]
MPTRSLNSSVLVWPDRNSVVRAVREWASQEAVKHSGLRRLGYFGSYARGDWGVGSDIDLIAVVADSNEPFERRPLAWDLTTLPVPAEVLVYTEQEWRQLEKQDSRFARTLRNETVWVYPEKDGQ